MPSSLPLASHCNHCLFSESPDCLSHVGSCLTCQNLPEMFLWYHNWYHYQQCHLFFSTLATGPECLQTKKLSVASWGALKSPLLLLFWVLQMMSLPLLLPIASLCKAVGKPWRSTDARISSAASLPLSPGVCFSSQISSLSTHSYWSED